VNAAKIGPAGNVALTASADGTVKVWDFRSGLEKKTFKAHSGEILDIAVSPDGCWAVTASFDRTIRVWEIAGAKKIATFTGDFAFTCCDIGVGGIIVAGDLTGGFYVLKLIL
jgi:WD40 repeat protein